jgi:hypothetical protein
MHHGAFKPHLGSFEFTGENDNATNRHCPQTPRLTRAAQAFLLRVGS